MAFRLPLTVLGIVAAFTVAAFTLANTPPAQAQSLLDVLERQLLEQERGQAVETPRVPEPDGRSGRPDAATPGGGSALGGRAKLSVYVAPVNDEAVRRYGLAVRQGALVTDVEPGGAGDRAGLAVGDVIVAADGRRIDTPGRLVDMISRVAPGHEIQLTFYSGPQLRRATVELDGMLTPNGAADPDGVPAEPAPLPPAPLAPPTAAPADRSASPAPPTERSRIGERLEATGRPLLGRLGRLIDRFAENPPLILGDGATSETAPAPLPPQIELPAPESPPLNPPRNPGVARRPVDPAEFREPAQDTDAARMRQQLQLLQQQVEALRQRLAELEGRQPQE